MNQLYHLCCLYLKPIVRKHPVTGKYADYFRLVESYRNTDNRVCHSTIINIGFVDNASTEQLIEVQKILNDKCKKIQSLFADHEAQPDKVVVQLVAEWWPRIQASNNFDMVSEERREKLVLFDSIKHKDVREIGTESICYNTWNQLYLSETLLNCGFDEDQIALVATQVISRAVYPASELKTTSWIKENSAVCELTGYNPAMLTKDKLYKSALDLYKHKDEIEKHLSCRTNELFDLQDKIILYDLTNTYFEGTKKGSSLAEFGRSKEKRSDAKLVVLALVCNVEGFIKYSSVLQGNLADSATLDAMIDKLAGHTCGTGGTVVIDAGIATRDNLALIAAKGFTYLCVSNTQIKDYTALGGRPPATITTKSGHDIKLQAISSPEHTDYLLEVKSPMKKAKEQGMKTQFEARFEDMLKLANTALSGKSGIKKLEKVHQRIGRARQKYPSVAKYYDIEVRADEKTGRATKITWIKNAEKEAEKEESLGRYFLRTNLDVKDEAVIWNIYNTIREIENVFRTLKTDLDLRPIYHKNDDATMAHLHLGILAYWLVNTVRFQLRQNNINSNWKEIVRIGNTQKMITTTGTNESGVLRQSRKCSEPDATLQNIYKILGHKPKPFTKRKSVVHKPALKKNERQQQREFAPG